MYLHFQIENEKIQNELRGGKKMYNEEKSLRILAESRVKTMESVQENVKMELKKLTDRVLEKNGEIDSLKKQVF